MSSTCRSRRLRSAIACRDRLTEARLQSLADFAHDISSGALKIVDLTHALSPEFPALQLPPQFGQVWAFKMEHISRYDAAGPGWYWNNFSCGEHTGTHFDAPVHWISGKDHANNSVDTIDPRQFIGPACVVDASKEVAADPDWLRRPLQQRQHGIARPGNRTAVHHGQRDDPAARLRAVRGAAAPNEVGRRFAVVSQRAPPR